MLNLYHDLFAGSWPAKHLLTSLLELCRAGCNTFSLLSSFICHISLVGADRRRWTLKTLLRLHDLHIVCLLGLIRIHLALLGVFQIHGCIGSYRSCWLSRCRLPLQIGHVVLDAIVMVPLQKIRQWNEVYRFCAQFLASICVDLRHLLIPLPLLPRFFLLWQYEIFEILVLEKPLLLLQRRCPGHAASLRFVSEDLVRELVVLDLFDEVLNMHLIFLTFGFLVLLEFCISGFSTLLRRCRCTSTTSHLLFFC